MFYEVANTVLPTVMAYVQQGGYKLMSKQIYISHDYLNMKIFTSKGLNGVERMTMDDKRKERTSPSLVFPWIRMANVLIAKQRVHKDLKQTG